VSEPWPNLFVVGVARAGTSSLAAYLGEHPDIFMSRLKEPYFFSDRIMRHEPFPKEPAAYLRLFDGAGAAAWRGEASTAYFWDPLVPARIHERSPDARFIISLRDPVERAYSGYWHAVQLAGETRSFQTAVEQDLVAGRDAPRAGEAPGYVQAGFYLQHLERWRAAAGSRLDVMLFDDLVRDPGAELARIFRWLGVDPSPAATMSFAVRNASVAPRNAAFHRVLANAAARRVARRIVPARLQRRTEDLLRSRSTPPMPSSARALLTSVYETEREPLEAFLGRQLPW
jgi:hypothetical protein